MPLKLQHRRLEFGASGALAFASTSMYSGRINRQGVRLHAHTLRDPVNQRSQPVTLMRIMSQYQPAPSSGGRPALRNVMFDRRFFSRS
jgi:hypothetical protein